MSTWRRKALESFPQLRNELNQRDFTIYDLFSELRFRLRGAYYSNDQQTLSRILEYAHWCLLQRRSEEPANAAGVAFYEHLFEDWSMHEEVLRRLSPDIILSIWNLWELFLDAEKIETLRNLVRERDETLYTRLKPRRPTADEERREHRKHRKQRKHSDGREVRQKRGKR